jgi:hypothetical protein
MHLSPRTTAAKPRMRSKSSTRPFTQNGEQRNSNLAAFRLQVRSAGATRVACFSPQLHFVRMRDRAVRVSMVEKVGLKILRFGLKLLQKCVALPHPLDNISFTCDKPSSVLKNIQQEKQDGPFASRILSKRARSAETAAASLAAQFLMYSCSLALQCRSGCETLQGGTPLSLM